MFVSAPDVLSVQYKYTPGLGREFRMKCDPEQPSLGAVVPCKVQCRAGDDAVGNTQDLAGVLLEHQLR